MIALFDEMAKYAKRGTLENHLRSEVIEALTSRNYRAPEQRTDPPCATPEEIWTMDMLDSIEEVLIDLQDLQDRIIYLENQFAAVNKGNLNYRPRFTICVDRPGAEPYHPELRRVRESVEAVKEELEEE